MAPQHFQVCGVAITRSRLRKFLAYGGCILMALDAIYGGTIVHHVVGGETGEILVTSCGKWGAAMSGLSVFFEHEAASVASSI